MSERSGWGVVRRLAVILAATIPMMVTAVVASATGHDARPSVDAGGVVRIHVPEGVGAKTVVGQLTVDRATGPGFVTAYPCAGGLPRGADGRINRSDLNYDGRVSPVTSNRLVVQADDAGDVCFYTLRSVELIVDLNGASFDTGISSFPNRRTDTRLTQATRLAAGSELRVQVPEARNGRTVVGQLTVDGATDRGYLTAYPCARGLPRDARDRVDRSDLNYDGRIAPVWSNRLIVEADANGEICIHTHRAVHVIVDLNGVADEGIASFPNRRTDSRSGASPAVAAGSTTRLLVPEAIGGKTVIGQLTVDRATQAGYVTAFPCAAGIPRDSAGRVARSDLNVDGRVSPVRSNRLIAQADSNGEVCLFSLRAVDLIVDVNAVTEIGILSFPNRRIDTRLGDVEPVTVLPPGVDGMPLWAPYEPMPARRGVAALTGLSVDQSVADRPILAVKVDNFRRARPPFGLDRADAVIEENVEGVTRFIALFHTHLPTDLGPVRSARTADLDLLAGMNRPVFAYSGANGGVNAWLDSATAAGVLVNFGAQRSPCYRRTVDRPGPHNLLIDGRCAVDRSGAAGPARAMWRIDPAWIAPGHAGRDGRFRVPMDGVVVEWTWDPASGRYLRSQDGAPHVAASGTRITASTVVELRVAHPPSIVDARSPHPLTVGTGSGVVHRNGRSVPVTWTRPTAFEEFTFRDAVTGAIVPADRGVTFVHLGRG